jgi:predicted MFS family arabinose efflux permease
LLPVQVMISRWFQRGHGLANSIAQSGSSLGQVVLIGLLATFLADLGWRAAFGILGIVFLASVLPLVLTMVPAERVPRPGRGAAAGAALAEEPPTPKFKELVRSGPLWSLVVVYFICGFHDTFVTTHIVAYATDEGLSQRTAGQLLAAMGIMALVGVLAAGAMADALGAGATTLLSFILRIGIFGLAILDQSEIAIFAFALMYAFTLPTTAPLVTVFMRDLYGLRNLAAFSSFILMVHQIGGGVGALTGGVLFDAAGSYETAVLVMAGLAVVACAATLAFMRTARAKARTVVTV